MGGLVTGPALHPWLTPLPVADKRLPAEMSRYLFTSESVTEGHPDKICDKVSDSLLDAYLAEDPKSRVAVETMVKTGFVVLGGEVTSKATIEIPKVVRKAITDIGYTDSSMGFRRGYLRHPGGRRAAVAGHRARRRLERHQGAGSRRPRPDVRLRRERDASADADADRAVAQARAAARGRPKEEHHRGTAP